MCKAPTVCQWIAYQCAQILFKCQIWMWEEVWGGCQPQPWHNHIILPPQVTQNPKICCRPSGLKPEIQHNWRGRGMPTLTWEEVTIREGKRRCCSCTKMEIMSLGFYLKVNFSLHARSRAYCVGSYPIPYIRVRGSGPKKAIILLCPQTKSEYANPLLHVWRMCSYNILKKYHPLLPLWRLLSCIFLLTNPGLMTEFLL